MAGKKFPVRAIGDPGLGKRGLEKKRGEGILEARAWAMGSEGGGAAAQPSSGLKAPPQI